MGTMWSEGFEGFFRFEWGFYALSASKAIFRGRTYNCITYSDDYLMNETRRKPTTGRQSPSLCDKWHGIFYMPSRIDEAGHTKAYGYPVAEHWGEISHWDTTPYSFVTSGKEYSDRHGLTYQDLWLTTGTGRQ